MLNVCGQCKESHVFLQAGEMFFFVLFPLSWVQSKYLFTYIAPPFSSRWSIEDKIRVSVGLPQISAERLALAVCVL